MCYSNSVSFIELLRSFCIHGEVCAKILCSEKELLNLKDSKLTQNFYGNKTGFVRLGHIWYHRIPSFYSQCYILKLVYTHYMQAKPIRIIQLNIALHISSAISYFR